VTRTRARSIGALIIFLICAVLMPLAVVGQWGNRTVTDQTQYLATMVPLASDEMVQAAVTDTLTDAVLAQIDTQEVVGGFLGNLLPNAGFTDTLATPIAAGINALIRQLIGEVLASEVFIDVWTEVNRAAQASLVAVLEGRDEGPIQTQDGKLVLDISTLLVGVQERLVDRGVGFAANITIEPGKRQIVLAEPPGLAQVQFIYRLANPLLGWAMLLLAVGFGIAVFLARKRPRMVAWIGVVAIGWGVLLGYALMRGEESFVNRLAATPLGPAADRFWSYFFATLEAGTRTMIAAGVLLIVLGWFIGASRAAVAARGAFRDLADRVRVYFPVQGGWSTRTLTIARGVAIAIGAFVFILADALGIASLIWATLIAAVLVFVVQVIGGQPRAAHQASSASFA
jgi:hypothetical protein